MGYVDYSREAPRIAERLHDIESSQRVLFLDCRHEQTGISPGRVLVAEGYLNAGYDTIVLRGGLGYGQIVDQDQIRDLRCSSALLVVESSADPEDRGPRISTPAWAARPASPISAEQLRRIELWGLITGHGALLGEPSQHFQLPSGFHIESYLRLRDAFSNVYDYERIVDWLLPYVDASTRLLGDRPAIAALLQTLALTCMRRFGWDLTLRTLGPYPRTSGSVANTVDQLNHDEHPILIVVGVDHAARQEQELMMLSPDGTTSVCLVDITDSEPASSTAFCYHPIRRWEQDRGGSCTECGTRSTLNRIDPRTEDVLPNVLRRPVKVTSRLVASRSALWKAVERTGALRIHDEARYNDGEVRRTRHRPIDIDMGALLQDVWFRTACIRELQKLERPDQILLVENSVTHRLVSIARDAWDDEIEAIVSSGSRAELSRAVRSVLPSRERILFMDGSLVTGQTVNRAIDNVFTALRGREAEHEVHVFVGLCCPDTAAIPERLRRNLARFGDDPEADRLRHVAVAYLPDNASCTFCEEADLLRRMAMSATTTNPLIRQRIEQLEGPLDSASLLFAAAPQRDDALVTIAQNCEVSKATAYAAFASAAQEVRSTINRDGSGTGYLDHAHAIARYPQAPMLAGILRTFGEEEINYLRDSSGVVAGMLEAADDLDARALVEIGWAAVTDKLPLPLTRFVAAALRRRGAAHDPVVALMCMLLERRTTLV